MLIKKFYVSLLLSITLILQSAVIRGATTSLNHNDENSLSHENPSTLISSHLSSQLTSHLSSQLSEDVPSHTPPIIFRSVAEWKDHYPKAKIQIVSAEQFTRMNSTSEQNTLDSINVAHIDMNEENDAVSTGINPELIPPSNSSGSNGLNNNSEISPQAANNPCKPWSSQSIDNKTTNQINGNSTSLNINPNLNLGSGGNEKEFLIILAVVGVVVVAALVVYSVSYIATMMSHGFECHAWDEIGFRVNTIDDESRTQNRRGRLNSIYYSKGYYIPSGVMGLSFEFGQYNFDLKINDLKTEKNYQGAFLLMGPSFYFPISANKQNQFTLELLAGTSNQNNIGIMSTIKMGFQFHINPQLNLGLNLGALLMDIKGFDNYLSDSDRLSGIAGLSTSWKF